MALTLRTNNLTNRLIFRDLRMRFITNISCFNDQVLLLQGASITLNEKPFVTMDVLLYDNKKTVNYTVTVSHTVVFKHFIANSVIHTLPDDKIFLSSTPTENAP